MSAERVKDLFERAAALPEAERHAFLAGECGADLLLRREVVSLLTFDPAQEFPDRADPVRLFLSAPRVSHDHATDALPLQQLGP
ncbi:MAG: hypothetical protein IPK26_13215 [Planctomycetes bacterium]|nr:hypothetical protein [Planctomycetota bacterium]